MQQEIRHGVRHPELLTTMWFDIIPDVNAKRVVKLADLICEESSVLNLNSEFSDARIANGWKCLLKPMVGSTVCSDVPLVGEISSPSRAMPIGSKTARQEIMAPWFGPLLQRYDLLDKVHPHSQLVLDMQAVRGRPPGACALHVYVDGSGGSGDDDDPAWVFCPAL